MLAGLAYVGACVYANFFAGTPGQPELPSVEKAPYMFVFEATGNAAFTASYEKVGTAYILHGYWEYDGSKWVYNKHDLDTRNFGEVTPTRRSRQ